MYSEYFASNYSSIYQFAYLKIIKIDFKMCFINSNQVKALKKSYFTQTIYCTFKKIIKTALSYSCSYGKLKIKIKKGY